MESDRTRWDRRHRGATEATPRPPSAVEDHGLVDQIPTTGRALDVAAGLGPVSRWAAQRGLDVVALDVSDVAIDTIGASPEADRIDARRVDLDTGLPDGLGTFDLVVCQRFRDVELIRRLPASVAPGGVLVVTVLSVAGADDPGPFHAPVGELRELFAESCAGWTWLHNSERDGEASVVLRRPVSK